VSVLSERIEVKEEKEGGEQQCVAGCVRVEVDVGSAVVEEEGWEIR